MDERTRGRDVETMRANQHRQITFRHYDTFAGKTPLLKVTQIEHQKPAIQLVAGKKRWRPALAVHNFQDFLICSRLIQKKRVPSNGLRYPLVGGTRQRHFDGTNFKPGKLPENAPTPTSRVHAVLGALSEKRLETQSKIPL